MNPYKTKKRGKTVWCIEWRQGGKRYRVHDPNREAVKRKHEKKFRDLATNIHTVKFTDEDRHAKMELGDKGTMMQAVRFFLAHRPGGIANSLEKAIEACCQAKEKRNRRPAYLTHLRFILDQFSTFIGPDSNCGDITRHQIERFLESKNWEATTKLGIRNRLSAFFSYSRKQGWCNINPVQDIELDSIEKATPHIFTVEQVHRLLDTAQTLCPVMIPFFTLGLFCGIRPDEIRRLPYAAVKADQAIVDLPAAVSKTRDRRLVELSENARAWLKVGKQRKKGDIVFFSWKLHRYVVAAARIEWKPDIMRHTFASYHIALHQSADKTAHELGHHGSTQMLFRHYKATVTKEEAEAFWKIEPAIAIKVLVEKTGTEN